MTIQALVLVLHNASGLEFRVEGVCTRMCSLCIRAPNLETGQGCPAANLLEASAEGV